jgi:hypothetical protein
LSAFGSTNIQYELIPGEYHKIEVKVLSGQETLRLFADDHNSLMAEQDLLLVT